VRDRGASSATALGRRPCSWSQRRARTRRRRYSIAVLFTGEKENSAARVSPGSLQEAGNNNMFLLTKLVPDHKYLSRLLKYENNPLIL